MKKIFSIFALALVVIGLVFGRETQIEWTMYLGMPLIIVFGSAGVSFVTKRLEAIIGGMVIAALWPVLFESFQTVLATLP